MSGVSNVLNKWFGILGELFGWLDKRVGSIIILCMSEPHLHDCACKGLAHFGAYIYIYVCVYESCYDIYFIVVYVIS